LSESYSEDLNPFPFFAVKEVARPLKIGKSLHLLTLATNPGTWFAAIAHCSILIKSDDLVLRNSFLRELVAGVRLEQCNQIDIMIAIPAKIFFS